MPRARVGSAIGALNAQATMAGIDSVLARQQVLNMINTKYFILNPSSQPLQNPHALGHGWIVKDYVVKPNADEVFGSLGTTDLSQVAVIHQEFGSMLSEDMKQDSVSGTVELLEYKPNHMVYEVSTDQKSLVVFSDIYYEGGWHATVDGEAVDHLRANYILRALPVEAGTHKVEFEFIFEPFDKGEKVSMMGSVLVLLVLLGSLGYWAYGRYFRKEELS